MLMLLVIVVGVGGGRSRVVEKADPLAGAVLSPHHRDLGISRFRFFSLAAAVFCWPKSTQYPEQNPAYRN